MSKRALYAQICLAVRVTAHGYINKERFKMAVLFLFGGLDMRSLP